MKIIVASNNEHKIREIKSILQNDEIELLSLKDAKIDIDVVEDGKTFEENAYKKASEIYEYLKEQKKDKTKDKDKYKKKSDDFYVLADDSGLEVDYLNGEPGVLSARYSGVHGDDLANNKKLLKELEGVPMEKRGAKFVCSMVLLGKKTDIRVRGEAKGYIIEEEKGFEGFGYDPLFHSLDLDKTFAESTSVEKNAVSHRYKALRDLRKELEK